MLWRDLALLVVTFVLGPPIASLVTLLGLQVAEGGLAALSVFDPAFFLGTIPFSYLLSWVPVLIVAAGNALTYRLVSETWRLLLALPIGAAPFLVMLGWLAENEDGTRSLDDYASIGLGGAVASFVTLALIEAFWPKSQQPSD